MRNIKKSLIILIVLMFSGCVNQEETSYISSITYSTTTSTNVLDYSDVKDKTILWSNIFGVDRDSYYVYFFSKTCSHCADLKQFILEKALEREDIYFVESSEQVVFVKDVSQTIGLQTIEGFGIMGYPSLIKIENKTITKNLVGVSEIRREISIE